MALIQKAGEYIDINKIWLLFEAHHFSFGFSDNVINGLSIEEIADRLTMTCRVFPSWKDQSELVSYYLALETALPGYFIKMWNSKTAVPSSTRFVWHVIWKTGAELSMVIGLNPLNICDLSWNSHGLTILVMHFVIFLA